MSKQTAMQLFVDKITNNHDQHFKDFYKAEIEEALQMEREQIIQAHGNKMRQDIENNIDVYFITIGQQYYNETYGGQDEK
jgi:bisphosphoglycerate-dependent phosphoglycerate mutase